MVQKLLENLSSPNQLSVLMAVIGSGAAILAIDQNGHHVIQYCLTHFSTEDNMVISETLFYVQIVLLKISSQPCLEVYNLD